nr:5-deoxy-glucuronate isomerase [Auraticoccus cholistanensis]
MAGDARRWVHRARTEAEAPGDVLVSRVGPEQDGWSHTGLEVRTLAPGVEHGWRLDGVEAGLLPLAGGVTVSARVPGAADVLEVRLDRAGTVFDGPADFLYLPVGSELRVTAGERGCRLAVTTAVATRGTRPQRLAAAEVPVELRGAGSCSRQVQDYTISTGLEVEHLLVCEVLTPGGNTSSFPPHKHDEHGEHERELEEIYYFEVADGPDGPGTALFRNYGTDARPLEVLAAVGTGDVALVPHGYHGPCVALPGYDLYYLNVMAGPATDGRWLSVDDPSLAWLRTSWDDQPVDPRLPLGRPGPDPQEAR